MVLRVVALLREATIVHHELAAEEGQKVIGLIVLHHTHLHGAATLFFVELAR